MKSDQQSHEKNSSSASADEPLPEEANPGSSTEPSRDCDCESYDFDSCLDDLLSNAQLQQSNLDVQSEASKKKRIKRSSSVLSLKSEIETFCSLPLEPRDSNPLSWWRVNHNLYPELGKVANKMLCSPPSSVESERLFSIGGNVYTPHRNRLTPETGEKLMLLNFNLRAFNLEY